MSYDICGGCDKPTFRCDCLRIERKLRVEAEAERDALRLVAIEARELVGEADATGSIPQANLDALRALLWRASVKSKSRVGSADLY